MELICIYGLVYEVVPVLVVNDIKLKFLFDFFTAELNVFLVAGHLGHDDFDVASKGVDQGLILGAFGELVEVGSKFEEIGLGLDVVMKSFHLMVSLFAKDEESDFVVGVNVVNAVDVRRYKLEDEHDVVSFVEVLLLVLLDSC